ncbi:DUF305 domain-containing protein [Frankia sp. R82]|uniref:DUF305 domain-containing protein n=1 Tax=Frankia sp. R82 TaxID=2950553 RepID=UPI0020439F11|nr:DUF305 domain-containing protein [Frankia sp. R82]MCM3883686.1 DUF305 domain-containing protein [Frankia sp. R82]
MKRLVLFVSALLAAAFLTACGSSTPDHNSTDTRFAQDMIPHHRQAVDMVGLVSTRTQNAQIRALATQIHAAQTPEIVTMTGWLTAWSEPVPSAVDSASADDGHPTHTHRIGGHEGHDTSGHDTSGHDTSGHGTSADGTAGKAGMGMMSDEDLAALAKTSGTAFDTMFLTMMITHHEGAIAMAAMELQGGRYPPAKQLAEHIRTSQTAEIATMRGLLGAR